MKKLLIIILIATATIIYIGSFKIEIPSTKLSPKVEKPVEDIVEDIVEPVENIIEINIEETIEIPEQPVETIENNLINLINKEREAYELAPLNENDLLNKSAESKVNDMLDNDYFAHGNLSQFLEGYNYRFAGEILARYQYTDDQIIKQWMESETHKDIILDTDFNEIGCYSLNRYTACHLGLSIN